MSIELDHKYIPMVRERTFNREYDPRLGRMADITFLRHGDRGRTAEDVELLEEAIEPVRDFARMEAQEISSNGGGVVKVLRGGRIRHHQTANIMEKEFNSDLYPNIRVIRSNYKIGKDLFRSFLNTDRTLGKIMEQGTEYPFAFDEWKKVTEDEARERDILSADEIGRGLVKRINIIKDVVDRWPQGENLHQYMVTSDTHIWSLAKALQTFGVDGNFDLNSPIDHIQTLRVSVYEKSERISCEFQGTRLSYSANSWDNMLLNIGM